MKKRTKIAAVPAAVLLALMVLAGCASLNNLINPVHAISSSGEKIAAQWGSGKTVKIEEAKYQYADRPAVPAAPKKPTEPKKPSPPSWLAQNIVVETGPDANLKRTVESFSSREEAIKKINFYRSKGQRKDISALDQAHALYVAKAISDIFDTFEAQQRQYESALAQYQTNLPKYQQELKKYEQENAAYQANLPKYRADVDAKIKAIQKSINPSAPENWVGYVEGKYLLYKGKAE